MSDPANVSAPKPKGAGANTMLDELDDMRELCRRARAHIDLLRNGVIVKEALDALEAQIEACEFWLPGHGYARRVT